MGTQQTRKVNPFILLGIVFFATGAAIVVFTFYPVIAEELRYRTRPVQQSPQHADSLVPIDSSFGIVIPKIGANAPVIANVDPTDSRNYQRALTKGVAHAKGTAYPGEVGNVFLFSHSSVNFYEAIRYNSVFYLLTKLEAGDDITVYYQEVPYLYRVTKKVLADPTDVSYLSRKSTAKTITLMTCWPPGTTFKRLLVLAQLVGD